jgi:DNA-binding transcriptional ArsR family regulator
MKYGPNISIVADLMGDPARSNMVMALMSGLSLSAAELASEAGVTPSTATGHLGKLESSGLLTSTKQGRHRYFRIADPDVAHVVEALIAVATRVGHLRTRPGPRDEAMRHARSCYDHLAGRLAVDLFERWVAGRVLRWRDELVDLTDKGRPGPVH